VSEYKELTWAVRLEDGCFLLKSLNLTENNTVSPTVIIRDRFCGEGSEINAYSRFVVYESP
jgi:hypothetical protein